MPADLTRAYTDQLRRDLADHRPGRTTRVERDQFIIATSWLRLLLDAAEAHLDEPARLASARAEAHEEGAQKVHAAHIRHHDRIREAMGIPINMGNHDWRHNPAYLIDTTDLRDAYDTLVVLIGEKVTARVKEERASAKAEGVREGIEMAVGVITARVNELQKLARETPYRAVRLERLAQATQASNLATAIRHISPPPAEPTGMTADGWIEWKGGECPVPGCTIVEAQHRNGECSSPRPAHEVDWDRYPLPRNAWDVVAYRIVKPAEPSAPVAPEEAFHNAVMAIGEGGRILDLEDEVEEQKTRIAALEAENAKLREIVEELDDALGEDEDEYPDDTPMTVQYGRTTLYALKLGLLRRARALLQGGPDAG